MSRFGQLLREYRNRSRDPKNENRSLTQERFADELARVSNGQYIYTFATISNWEKVAHTPRFDDRDLLLAQLKVLNNFGGVATLEEANRLLRAGYFLELQPAEISAINESWQVEDSPEEDPPVNETYPTAPATPWLVFLSSIGMMLQEFKVPLNQPSQRDLPLWNPERIFILACWFAATVLVWQFSLPLLYWPLQDPLNTVVVYSLSTIIIPTQIALVVWMDQRRFWPDPQPPRGSSYLWTIVGALIGFHASYLFLFAIFLVMNDLDLPGLGDLGSLPQVILASLIVFCSVLGARQVPLEMSRTYEELPFTRRDWVMLITLVLIGPAVGWVFYNSYSLLLDQPLAGTAVVLIVILALSGFTLWQQRRSGTSVIPTFAWAMLFGLFWILYIVATGEPYQIVVVTITITTVVVILWIWESRRV